VNSRKSLFCPLGEQMAMMLSHRSIRFF